MADDDGHDPPLDPPDRPAFQQIHPQAMEWVQRQYGVAGLLVRIGELEYQITLRERRVAYLEDLNETQRRLLREAADRIDELVESALQLDERLREAQRRLRLPGLSFHPASRTYAAPRPAAQGTTH